MTPDHPSDWPFDLHEAVQHLSDQDERLASLIHRIGPVTLTPRSHEEPFVALLRAIVYQQLSGKAAGTIHGRVLERTGDPPKPETVLALTDDELRACGLSRAKTAAVKDLALHTEQATVPDVKRLREMTNPDIIDRLTRVRGIGPWTVQMYLMFGLGRPDILPTTDLGIQKGIQRLDGLADLPGPADVETRGEVWRPYRTIASWYLWRSVDD
jgi:DNA-3-methyladenine glycosylase II